MKTYGDKLIVASLVVFLSVVAVSEPVTQKTAKDESLRRGETRVTLNPAMFSDPKIRQAYQAAKDIPWVLDSIYCFCYCEESPTFRHKSLLSCYVDNHAAMWDICLGEALRAFELYKKGYSVKEIRDMVEKEYKR